jgi:hypothetical protein
MKFTRLLASVSAVGRVLRWKPKTYRLAWLFAPFGLPLAVTIGFGVHAALNRWDFPWFVYAMGFPVFLVGQGLAWSYDVHRRDEYALGVSTGA